jgi:hypothetical protein
LLLIPLILESKNTATAQNKIIVKIVGNISAQNFSPDLSFTLTGVLFSGLLSPKSHREYFSGKIAISFRVFSVQFSVIFSHAEIAINLFPSIRISLYFKSL